MTERADLAIWEKSLIIWYEWSTFIISGYSLFFWIENEFILCKACIITHNSLWFLHHFNFYPVSWPNNFFYVLLISVRAHMNMTEMHIYYYTMFRMSLFCSNNRVWKKTKYLYSKIFLRHDVWLTFASDL